MTYVCFYPYICITKQQQNNIMKNFTLKFGKYKGQQFLSTPKNYQDWLLKQDWFKIPSEIDIMPKISKNWDGYSRKGQSQEWSVFEWEKRQSERQDCKLGICTCCTDSSYYGL